MQVNSIEEKNIFGPNFGALPMDHKTARALIYFLREILDFLELHLDQIGSRTVDTWSADKVSGEFYELILERHQEIVAIREKYRLFINQMKLTDSIYEDLGCLSDAVYQDGTYELARVSPVFEGISGTYFLKDEEGNARFVIKPFDEEAGCVNNPKFLAGFTYDNPVRNFIPLYRSAMRETLAYQLALQIGVESIVPKTVLAIVEASQFHDFSDHLEGEKREEYLEKCGPADRVKLCSVQEYVAGSKPLFQAIDDLEYEGLTDREIAARFDQSDFEDANLLIWTTYDTDAHMGNLIAYPKGVDEFGHEIIGLKKIDNGLAFPDKNRQLRNELVFMENGKQPLSDNAKSKIAQIDVDALVEQFKVYGLESAVSAFKERMAYLKKISAKQAITIKEIDKAMAGIR